MFNIINDLRHLRAVTMRKYQKVIGVVLTVFTVLSSIAIINHNQTTMSEGLMSNAEQITIINVRFIIGNDVLADQLKVTLQNFGYCSVTISNGYLNGTQATSINPQPAIIEKGYSSSVTLTLKPHTLVDRNQYEVKLMTSRGNTIVRDQAFDAVYSAQHNFDEPLPTPILFIGTSRVTDVLPVMGSVITVWGLTICLFLYSKVEHVRKRALSIKEFAIVLGVISEISLLIPLHGNNLYFYPYDWLSTLFPFVLLFFVACLSYGIWHLTELIAEGKKRRSLLFALVLLAAIVFSYFVFVFLSKMLTPALI